MRFGIDFGTTRIVVAACDRGNYPIVHFEDTAGDAHAFAPALLAWEDGLVAGWDAATSAAPLRSLKRVLGSPKTLIDVPVPTTAATATLALTRYIYGHLKNYALAISDGKDSEVEAVIGVPATANSAQRLATLDAFARAGVNVLGLMDEPSAAAYEFTHRHPRALNSKRQSVIVYDLGGGTFDATYISAHDNHHTIHATAGLPGVGGDDFDQILVHLALDKAGLQDTVLSPTAHLRLTNEARQAKEALHPQTRRMVIDVAGTDVIISTEEFYEACQELIERTITAMEPVSGTSLTDTEIAGIYLVGGATNLPAIPRRLRENFGRRVHRSPLPEASTAVGLAIAADPDSGYSLSHRITRGVGVFREREEGEHVSFDPLITPDTPLNEDGSVTVTNRYHPQHNIGWYRFVEYTDTDMATLTTVVVPFAPELEGLPRPEVETVRVERREAMGEVEETVHRSADGIVSVSIRHGEDVYSWRAGERTID